jgi:hypothetical protein
MLIHNLISMGNYEIFNPENSITSFQTTFILKGFFVVFATVNGVSSF